MSETKTPTRPIDERPLIVRYIARALSEWPPLAAVELVGVAPTTSFITLRLNLIETEYYPFDVVRTILAEDDLEAEVIGLDTTTESDVPRLILAVSHSCVFTTRGDRVSRFRNRSRSD